MVVMATKAKSRSARKTRTEMRDAEDGGGDQDDEAGDDDGLSAKVGEAGGEVGEGVGEGGAGGGESGEVGFGGEVLRVMRERDECAAED